MGGHCFFSAGEGDLPSLSQPLYATNLLLPPPLPPNADRAVLLCGVLSVRSRARRYNVGVNASSTLPKGGYAAGYGCVFPCGIGWFGMNVFACRWDANLYLCKFVRLGA